MSSIARGTFWNLSGSILPLVLVFFITPALIHNIGLERFGILSIIWMIVGYFNLFDFGLGQVMTQQIASKRSKNEDVSSLIWTGVILLTLLGILGGIFVNSLSPFIVNWLKASPETLSEVKQLWPWLSICIPLMIIQSGFRGTSEGFEDFQKLNILKILLGLFNWTIPFAISIFSSSLYHITFGIVFFRFLALFTSWWICKDYFSKPAFYPQYKQLLKFGGWITISNTIVASMYYIDRFAMSYYFPASIIPYYTVSIDALTKISLIPNALAATLFPNLSKSQHTSASISAAINKFTYFLFFIGTPIMIFIIFFAHPILSIWLGKEFAENGIKPMQYIALGVWINFFAATYTPALNGGAQFDAGAKINTIILPIYLTCLYYSFSSGKLEYVALSFAFKNLLNTLLLYIFSHTYLNIKISDTIIPTMLIFLFVPIMFFFTLENNSIRAVCLILSFVGLMFSFSKSGIPDILNRYLKRNNI